MTLQGHTHVPVGTETRAGAQEEPSFWGNSLHTVPYTWTKMVKFPNCSVTSFLASWALEQWDLMLLLPSFEGKTQDSATLEPACLPGLGSKSGATGQPGEVWGLLA